MDDLTIELNDAAFRRQLTNLERTQLPYAASRALNDTAYDALKHIQNQMDVVFDKPTRFTKNALMVWRADRNNLEAQVKERPSVGRRHFLKVQEAGGARPQTGVERLLSANVAYSGFIAAVIPAAGAKLDAYGNWSSGQRNQVLSALGAQRDTASNETDASRARNKGRASYFVPQSGLSPGVYRRSKAGKLDKILSFTSNAPNYSQRLGFYDGVQEVWVAKLPGYLSARLAEAVANAR
jgi:hypothetical protein